jgi:hypothetical protein
MSRIRIRETDGAVMVSVRADRRYGVSALVCLSLYLAIGAAQQPAGRRLIGPVLLTIALVSTAIWSLLGSEQISVSAAELTFARKLPLLPAFLKRSYAAAEIEHLRLQKHDTRVTLRFDTTWFLAFDYRGGTITLSRELSEAEGKELLEGPLRGLAGRSLGPRPG